MRKLACILSLITIPYFLFAQPGRKIIDMHIHCYDSADFAHPVDDPSGHKSSTSAGAHFADTYAALMKAGVVKAVISGSPTSVDAWMAKDKRGMFIPGIMIDSPTDFGMTPARFEQMVRDKKIQVFGEVEPYYAGMTLADSAWQPYLRICERYDIPVAVHLGGGPPETPFHGLPKARLSLSDPFLIEDVLVKYPKLRVYMMHSGEVYYEHAIRMLLMYPNLYSDLGVLLWVVPYTQDIAVKFLKLAKQGGFLDRVMYGTDQMVWPYAIEKSLRFLDAQSFLTKKEQENILYNNAARFLRLNER